MEVHEFLAQLAPGQGGIIYQGLGNWRQVSCQQVLGESVIMQVHEGKGEGEIALGEKVAFKTRCDTGFLRVEGTFTGGNSERKGFEFHFTPQIGAEVVNRRQAFRVNIDISTKMTGTAAATAQDRYDSEWECVLRDLSVGGANVVLASPGPAPRSSATITFSLPTEDDPLVLECVVIDVAKGASTSPMDTAVRLMFTGLNLRMENQLGKYINWVQLEVRRNGLI